MRNYRRGQRAFVHQVISGHNASHSPFRFTPESGYRSPHSITSSAATMKLGTLRPKAFAVLRLSVISNRVGV